ncbi:MAG TPA: hypothetical protein VFK50_10940 [Sphingomicrobium sp.]|nr:hypothetical protein [Sphingomicrobium sp.]
MTKLTLLLTAAAATACTASTAAPKGSDDNRPLGPISWTIDGLDRRDDGKVQLGFRTGEGSRNNSHWSNGYDLVELEGLASGQLNGASQPARFSLNREAGRLDCAGTVGNGQGAGTCSFAPDSAFAGRLAAAGIGRPTGRQAYDLTLAKVRYDLVEELTRQGYDKPTVSDLVGLGIHGATAGYVREIADAGYRFGKVDGLVQFRIFGINGRFIGDMAAIGPQFRALSPEDLVQFKIFKVQPELVRAYTRLGYPAINARDLVAMQIHGVSPDFVTDLAALGYRNVPTRKLVELRIHGVTADFIRDLKGEGVALPSPDQLVRLRLAGYRPGNR